MTVIYDAKTNKTIPYKEIMEQRRKVVNKVVKQLFSVVEKEELQEEDLDRILYLFNSEIKEWKKTWAEKEKPDIHILNTKLDKIINLLDCLVKIQFSDVEFRGLNVSKLLDKDLTEIDVAILQHMNHLKESRRK